MTIAIIPARGGSQRIPRKNIRLFAGKPMIAHSIAAARKSQLFDRVIVTTEDEEIAQVARDYGAEIPFMRPAELADDHTPVIAVVSHAVRSLGADGDSVEAVCCISATAPFLRAADLHEALAILRSGIWQYVFSATMFQYPIFRAFERTAGGGIRMFFPENLTTRSQDLPAAMHDAAQFYWGRVPAWVNGTPLLHEHSTPLLIPAWRVCDIDTLDDWVRAEILMTVIDQMEKDAGIL